MTLLVATLVGASGWSLTEYIVHRWLGHKFTKNFFGREHVAHHGKGNYFAPSWKKGGAALATAALLIGPAVLVAGPAIGSAFVAGFVGFYLYYELLHRLEHVWEGVGPYARWARVHHFHHHFHDPRVNHGVTSPVWDLVFGTYVKPGIIRVPEKLQMPWLVDPATGDVRAHLQAEYELRRSRRRPSMRAAS
jgi:sterol desaturase/sphingolipid hydroxylase (fatty acid hydroxylase superfamily)